MTSTLLLDNLLHKGINKFHSSHGNAIVCTPKKGGLGQFADLRGFGGGRGVDTLMHTMNAIQSFVRPIVICWRHFMLFIVLTANETPVTIRSNSLVNYH